jgi:uncharacterized damage-inducible protein DinB/quinol monooxygenase YgiN
MIDQEYARTMAQYNRWQNGSLYAAADTLSDAARRQDRGAFFGSIHATLNHLLWGDRMWMSRFSDVARPATTLQDSGLFVHDWTTLRQERVVMDDLIMAWAERTDAAAFAGALKWRSSIASDVVKPRWCAVTHFFNHQTHHRGQVHAMLTAAGAKPQDTDLIMMPHDSDSSEARTIRSRILVTGTVRLPPASLNQARSAMREMIMASRGEIGCLEYTYSEDVLEPGLIHVKELWESSEALRAHLLSGHLMKWRSNWERLGISDRKLVSYEVAEPEFI